MATFDKGVGTTLTVLLFVQAVLSASLVKRSENEKKASIIEEKAAFLRQGRQEVPEATVPPLPEVTVPALPEVTVPALPEVTVPPLPEVTAPALPEITAPSLPEVTAPALPEVTAPALPEVTAPSLPEITPPALPEVTAPSLPEVTAPALPEITPPALPEITPPALPEITPPALPEVTAPALPEITPPALPEITPPALPEVTAPALPEVTAPALPEVTAPALPEITAPALPEVTAPSLPEVTAPALPEVTAPALPEITPPALPEITPPALPEVTAPALPEVTAPPLPEITAPSLPEVTVPPLPEVPVPSAFPALDTLDVSNAAAGGVSLALMAALAQKGPSSSEKTQTFTNPSYPKFDTSSGNFPLTLLPSEDTCVVRFDFIDTYLEAKRNGICTVDSILFFDGKEISTVPLCGRLAGYQVNIKANKGSPVIINVKTQSYSYLWNIQVTQIPCSNIPDITELSTPGCGQASPMPAPETLGEIGELSSLDELLLADVTSVTDQILTKDDPISSLPSDVFESLRNSRIVGGNKSELYEWPWQTLLLLNGQALCAGALIHPEYIVTAAHCVNLNVDFPVVPSMAVDLGDYDLSDGYESDNVIIPVSNIILNWQTDSVKNDIALVKIPKLKLESAKINPVCLPKSEGEVKETTGIVTGWGRTALSPVSPILQKAEVDIIPRNDCRKKWQTLLPQMKDLITERMICTEGKDREAVGPCQGDSGDPLVTKDSEGIWTIQGVAGYGRLKSCGIPNIPSVYAKVSSFLKCMSYSMALP